MSRWNIGRWNGLYLTLLIITKLSSSGLNAQCGCTFTIPAGAGAYTFDGVAKGAKPGDVICLSAGAREKIIFQNLTGNPNNYIKILNCGGQALIGGPLANQAISFSRSKYFQISGTGDPGFPYGIKIVESKPGSQGIQVVDLSSDVEIDHIEITKTGFAGIMAKSDPSKDCGNYVYERTNPGMTDIFVMRNVVIHHNYVHDIGGEGIYCGNSYYKGATAYCPDRTQYPHEIRGVKIYENIFDNCAWESIQVGSAVLDVEIHDNKLFNYGAANVPSQNGGIQVGVGSTGRVYNNFIKSGMGMAIFVQGIGDNYVYNNVIVNSGTYAILMSLNATPLVGDIVPVGFVGGAHIMNNTIIKPSLNDAVVKESVVGPPGNVLYNNLIVGGQSNWLKLRGDTDWKQGNNQYLATLAEAKFVNPAVDDYRLLTGSPAINAGKDVASFGVTYDFDNRGRPSSTSIDLGAFEFQGNQKPIVSTGPNQSIILPTVVTTLTGNATDPDGSIASYVWTKQSGPPAVMTNTTTTTLSVAGLVGGVYVFRLTASDNGGETGFKNVTLTVVDPSVNQSPVANSGGNKTVILPATNAVLTGSAYDVDGIIVSYSWTKLSVPAVTMANAATPTLTLTGLTLGPHLFRLTVTDDDGDTDTMESTITVQPVGTNLVPIANAGVDKTMSLPTNSVSLSGSGADPDGSITAYAWTKKSGGAVTLTNANTATLQLAGMAEGIYVFRLTVTDNKAATGYDEVTVTVSSSNQAPLAEAGNNKTIQLPTNSTTLPGSGSDADGSVTTYLWTKVTGPPATLANAGTATLSLTGLVEGTYLFRLSVTDNNGATGSDEITLTVQEVNVPPTSDAGPTLTLILPANATTLVGSGSDVDGTVTVYLWEKVSGPAATLASTNQPALALTDLVAGSYVFRLTVTDNSGATGSNEVSVVVFPTSTNQSPVVEAGTPVTITLPANSGDLTAVASDPDGTISSFLWEKVNGPAGTLSGTTTTTLALSNLVGGSYLFRLTVTDDKGFSASDEITVTVANTNQKPSVSAGDNIIVVLPVSTATLTAVASDPDGTVAGYSWTLGSGPGPVSLSGSTTSVLLVNGLIAGVYVFRITVTDNSRATSSDEVNITVQTLTNISPVSDAGPDEVIFLPTNLVNVTGSGSDADGTIASYAWSKVSGGAATLTNTSSATLSVAVLMSGGYVFRLTITDNEGGIGIDDVTVTANPASANQSPVANAGPDISLVLPNNSTNLIGSGSDADGTITAYQWLKVSGPSATLSNSNTPVLSLKDLIDGIYAFRLTVSDNRGASAAMTTVVTVLPSTVNQTPKVGAGNNITITLPNNTVIVAAMASDPDGSIGSYLWTKQVGPTATVAGGNSANLSLTNLVEGLYLFRVTVADNLGSTSFSQVIITVLRAGSNQPPVTNAGLDAVLFLPNNLVNLSGTASDADGSITRYSWDKIRGPAATITNQDTPNVTLSSLEAGQYTFRLTSTDNSGATSFDETTVTVFPGTVNQSPVANAGSNKTIVLPITSCTLTGSGFDPDGSIASYAWTQKTGPACEITNIDSPSLDVNNLTIGTFQFQLTVVDDDGATGSDLVLVNVVAEGVKQPPIADAGFDKVIKLPQNSINIQGVGSDPDGTIVSYAWLKKSGPAAITLAGQSTPTLLPSGLVAGIYQFNLTVVDNDGLSNTDDVKVTVLLASVNANPIVNAGSDVFIRLPSTATTLTAVASDIDGSITGYLWTKQSGPAATLTANASTLSCTDLEPGSYVFRVEVTDNTGASSSDEVTVVLAPEGTNTPPVVLAGSAKTIALPETSTVLNGSGSDPDGSITSLTWAQETGPSTAILTGINSATLVVENLNTGTYTFRLTAVDNENATAFSETSIEVKIASTPPTVFAGNDTTLVLPNNAISLVGEAAAGEGFIQEYVWTQTDGPFAEMIGIYPEVTIGKLNAGVYAFTLTVTDSRGNQATDDIVVTVEEGASNPIGASIVFTPNGDAVNDTWVIKNKNMISGCPIAIFNGLGKKVFEADSYENDWNGTFNGQQAREGDYYFVLECRDKKTYSGALRLIR